jgi:hypothetical protein
MCSRNRNCSVAFPSCFENLSCSLLITKGRFSWNFWHLWQNISSWFAKGLVAHINTNIGCTVFRTDKFCILGKWQTWCTILYRVFIFIFNSLHVSSTSCSSSGETNCVNTTSGNCQSVSVTMSCAGWKWTSDLHTTRPPTQSNSYQRLCWHNLSLLMMSTMCSKHVES